MVTIYLYTRKSTQQILEHKEKIKRIADQLIFEIHRDNLRNKIILVNTYKYPNKYLSNKESILGYSSIKGEIKATKFDGVSFFASTPMEIYRNKKDKFTFKPNGTEKFNIVFPVGTIPYEWITNIDLEGDEYDGYPIFYCKFKGNIPWRKLIKIPLGFPYKYVEYFTIRDEFNKNSDTPDMRWHKFQEKILDNF